MLNQFGQTPKMFQYIRVPHQSAGYLYEHNRDKQTVTDHLNVMRGPIHSMYIFDVLNTCRLIDLPGTQNFRTDLSDYQVLMHGMAGNAAVETLVGGFSQLSSEKFVFGSQYYFTSCSTKAANQTVPGAWNFGKKSDAGIIEPKDGSIGYILFCVVGTGKSMSTTTRTKYPSFKHHDSIVFRGALEPTYYFPLDVFGIKARVPISPYREMIGHTFVNDTEKFYFDEICVDTPDKVLPFILAEVMFKGVTDDLC